MWDLPKLLNQRYEIQETLLAGSESQVYKGFDTRKKLPVLIKAYAPALLKDWKRFQLVEREAQTLAQLDHIQIPYFVDFFTLGSGADQSLFLVTEFIQGQSLAEKLASGWRPPTDAILALAEQLLQILAFLQGFVPPIVHRDIKPANLILTPYNRLYLVDFGGVQAVMVGQGAGGSTLVGTLGYIAPEQILGQALPASDLYAVGMTLLELFSAQTDAALPSPSPQSWDLPTIQACLPEQRPELHNWLFHLVTEDLNLRYESAEMALRVFDLMQDKDPDLRQPILPEAVQRPLPELAHDFQLPKGHDHTQALPVGTTLLSRYTLKQCLGAGTHSWVYAAEATHSPKPLIVKELRVSKLENWKNLELFERETEILKALRHPRIPAYVDSFQLESVGHVSCVLVTEAVAGKSVEHKLEQGWRPTSAEIWDLAAQVLEILCYLAESALPVVHRDIKPSNLILNAAGEVFLIDFGAVQNRLMSQSGGGSTIIGTFGYMAPEQFAGAATPQTDLYGLGATLLRLLSGRHPVEIPSEGTGLDFRSFVQVEPFYLHWLEHCLKPLPQARFDSPRQALDLLRDHTQGGKIAAQWLKAQNEQERKMGTARLPRTVQLSHLIPPSLALERLPRYFKGSEFELREVSQGIEIQLPGPVPLMQAGLKQRQRMALNFWLGIASLVALIPIGFAVLILMASGVMAMNFTQIMAEAADPYSMVSQLMPIVYVGLLGAVGLPASLGYGFWYTQRSRQGQYLPWLQSAFAWLIPRAVFRLQPDRFSLSDPNDPSPLCLELKWQKITQFKWTPCLPDYPYWSHFGPARPYELVICFDDYLFIKRRDSRGYYRTFYLTLLLSEEGQQRLEKSFNALLRQYGKKQTQAKDVSA